jgi:hypothetical protein
MPFLLLFETLLEGFHQLVPAAHGLDLSLLLVGEFAHHQFFQPIGRQLPLQLREYVFDAFEVRREGAVVAVVELLVLDQTGTRQIVKAFGAHVAQTGLEGLEQRQ